MDYAIDFNGVTMTGPDGGLVLGFTVAGVFLEFNDFKTSFSDVTDGTPYTMEGDPSDIIRITTSVTDRSKYLSANAEQVWIGPNLFTLPANVYIGKDGKLTPEENGQAIAHIAIGASNIIDGRSVFFPAALFRSTTGGLTTKPNGIGLGAIF